MRVLVLNGPNLGTLGRREPEVYGTQTLADLEKLLNERARELEFVLTCLQSNHEGQLIDWIEKEGAASDAIIINPGAFSHYSLALADALVGSAGEVIDLRRVFLSHGIAELPPMRLDQKAWTFEITVPLPRIGARTLILSQARPGRGLISVAGPSPTPQVGAAILAQFLHVLSLDLDLTPFYTVAAEDADLAWVLTGAGRMVRSPTVFEDVVKTVCTTKTSWCGTP